MSQYFSNYDEVRQLYATGMVPTVPPSEYKSDGSWIVTDLEDGQFCINRVDGKAWYRAGANIIEIETSLNDIEYLEDLLDVDISGVTTGEVLTFDGTNWINSGITSGDELPTGTTGQILVNDGTEYISSPDYKFIDETIRIYNDESNIIIGDDYTQELGTPTSTISIGSYAGYKDDGLYNINIGNLAGPTYYTATGQYNINLGRYAGRFGTTTEDCVNIGNSAGSRNRYGEKNVCLGTNAGAYHLGSYSTFIGNNAGSATGAVSNIVGIGYDAMRNLTTGNNSQAIGTYAGTTTTSANGSLFMGAQAGRYGTTQNYCTFLGAYAGLNNEADNNCAIGPYAQGLGVTIGEFNVAIGAYTHYKLTSGQMNTAIGFYTHYSLTEGSYNLGLGSYAQYSLTTGEGNVALGANANRTCEDGSSNVAVGVSSLYYNTSSYNTAVGNKAMYLNETGQQNCAVGRNSLQNNTDGDSNCSFGEQTMQANTLGTYNTAYGRASLYYNQTGNNNTALGGLAGLNALGDGNVFLGYQAGYNETGSNKLYISNNLSTTLIIGDFSTGDVEIENDITAQAFIKDGGLSTEFLKADGSVDSNTYLVTETDPIFVASEAYNITSTDITNLSNLSGINTGDQDLSGLIPYTGATTDVDLGSYDITANQFIGDGSQLTNLPSQEYQRIIVSITSATYTLNETGYDEIILIKDYSGNQTITIDTDMLSEETKIIIKGDGSNKITIETEGSETIDGDTDIEVKKWDSVTLITDGTNWFII